MDPLGMRNWKTFRHSYGFFLLPNFFGSYPAGDAVLAAENMKLYGLPSLAVWGTLVLNTGLSDLSSY